MDTIAYYKDRKAIFHWTKTIGIIITTERTIATVFRIIIERIHITALRESIIADGGDGGADGDGGEAAATIESRTTDGGD